MFAVAIAIVAAQVAAAQQKAAAMNAQAGWAQPLAAPQPQVTDVAPVPAFEATTACTEKPSRLLTD